MPHTVFISYNSLDVAPVKGIVKLLSDSGLIPCFDKSYRPGTTWLAQLEQYLASCNSVCVFHGPNGFGPWQQREIVFALERQGHGGALTVIPVLLPGSDGSIGLLSSNHRIDLRGPNTDTIADLVKGILGDGVPPGGAGSMALVPAGFSPYRGLRAFREEDAPFFHGREESTQAIHAAVEQHQIVTVCGASGSGKSSVVHAGLVPLLRGSRAPIWEVISTTPADRPLHSLAAALLPLLQPDLSEVDRLVEVAKLAEALRVKAIALSDVVKRILARQPGTERVLLVLDQWEQMHEIWKDGAEGAAVRAQLLDATAQAPLKLLLNVRVDFLGTLLDDREFSPFVRSGLVPLGPLDRAQLARAIVEPARRLSHEFEPGLVDKILDQIEGEPGVLPLLELALQELWEQRGSGWLTHAAFSRLGEIDTDSTSSGGGGIRGIVAARAERAAAVAITSNEDRLRRLFRRLVQAVEEGGYTRCRVRVAELDEGEQSIAQELVDMRLLVADRDPASGDGTLEVVHDALIDRWERLRKWLDEDRVFLLWRRGLDRARLAWESTHTEPAHRESDALLRGVLLQEAERQSAGRSAELSLSNGKFIELSRRHASLKQAAGRRQRLALLGAGLVGFLILVALAVSWLTAAKEASANARLIRDMAVVQIARGWLDRDPTMAAMLLGSLDPDREPQGGLRVAQEIASHHNIAYAWLRGHLRGLVDAQFSPDGRRVVTASSDNTARVWNADGTAEPVVLSGHAKAVNSAAFSPDGRRVVTASDDLTARVWNADGSGEPVILSGHAKPVNSAAFSPDGRRVVTASSDETARVWSADGSGEPVVLLRHNWAVNSAGFSPDGRRVVTASNDTARVWNADGSSEPVIFGHKSLVNSAAFSPDGRRVVTASDDRIGRVWNADGSGEPVALSGHTGTVYSAAFSPDGRRVVTASLDQTARVWNADGSGEPVVLLGHAKAVTTAAFSPDGRRIITASLDDTARAWNADGTGEPVIFGHKSLVNSAAFSPDGRRVVTASDDLTAGVWNADGSGEPVILSEHNGAAYFAAFSLDGRRVVTASGDSNARVWNADGTGEPVVLRGHTRTVYSAAFSPDGRSVVTASSDETARVWNVDGSEPVVLSGHESLVHSAAFSPDSRRVVTASGDRTARVWNADGSGKPVILRGHESLVHSAAFSPDGRRVVTASFDGTARVWNADGSGEPISVSKHAKAVNSAAFSPDGRRIVTGSSDKTARVWNADGTGESVVLAEHAKAVTSAAFSPDGRRVVTASDDGTAQVWNIDGSPEPVVLRGHKGAVYSAAFSPDGRRVVTASFDSTARVWSVDWRGVIDQVRNSTAGKLEVDERMRYLLEPREEAQRNVRERVRARGEVVTPN